MTLEHVEAIIGPAHEKQLSLAKVPVHWFAYWSNDEIRVDICFSMEDKVRHGGWAHQLSPETAIYQHIGEKPTLWEQIRKATKP